MYLSFFYILSSYGSTTIKTQQTVNEVLEDEDNIELDEMIEEDSVKSLSRDKVSDKCSKMCPLTVHDTHVKQQNSAFLLSTSSGTAFQDGRQKVKITV